jgi:hypothetical protein
MLKILEDKSTPNCLVAELDGKITVDEFRAYATALDAAIEAGEGKASAVCLISSSPSEDWGSFKEDLRLARRDASKLTRVAYVGNVKWVELGVKASGWLWRGGEVRVFPSGDLDAAIAWAQGGARA